MTNHRLEQESHINPNENDIEVAFGALSNSASSTDVASAISSLAYASRHDVGVRERLASAQCLNTLTEQAALDSSDSRSVADSALRCIGNACADNEAGRTAIIDIGFHWAEILLDCGKGNDAIGLLTSKVLFNICKDCEPAQQACYSAGLHIGLLRSCGTEYVQNSEDASFVIDSILWICAQKANVEPDLKEDLPDDVLELLIRLPKLYAHSTDAEGFASLVEAALVFLRDVKVQKQVIKNNELGSLWELLQVSESRLNLLEGGNLEDDEDRELLAPLSTSLMWCLSDIAANIQFAEAFSLDSGTVKQLIDLIKARGDNAVTGHSDPRNMLLTTAAQIVGNLLWARPPSSYGYLVEVDRLHASCFQLIVQDGGSVDLSRPELSHALAGLLVQLTRPSVAIRELMGADEHCRAALKILSEHAMTLIKQDSVKLIKALGKDCPSNQDRLGQLAKDALLSIKDSSESAVANTEAN